MQIFDEGQTNYNPSKFYFNDDEIVFLMNPQKFKNKYLKLSIEGKTRYWAILYNNLIQQREGNLEEEKFVSDSLDTHHRLPTSDSGIGLFNESFTSQIDFENSNSRVEQIWLDLWTSTTNAEELFNLWEADFPTEQRNFLWKCLKFPNVVLKQSKLFILLSK